MWCLGVAQEPALTLTQVGMAGWTGQLWSCQEDFSRSDSLIPNPGEYLSGLALYPYIVMRNWGP